jgi:hypothetical protein
MDKPLADHMFVFETKYGLNVCAFKHCQKPQNEHVEEAFLESDRDYSIDPHRGM